MGALPAARLVRAHDPAEGARDEKAACDRPARFRKVVATGLWPVPSRCYFSHSETAHRAVATAPAAYTPSTRIMFVLAVRCRILRGSRYCSLFSQSLARCADSN